MKWQREEYLSLMTFGGFPRPMFVELFGPLIGLDDEWRAQGASEDEINMVAFDWDHVDRAEAGGRTGWIDGLPEETLEETDEHVIRRDHLGRTVKLCKGVATLALPLDFPVKNMDDWLRFKPMFEFRDDRIDPDQIAAARQARDKGALVRLAIPGAYDTPRELMGEEVACLAYYEQPELVHEIMGTLRDTCLAVLDRIGPEVQIDMVSVHEDLAGKSGPLIGPRQVAEFVQPYFRPVWDRAVEHGARLFSMDTDGNFTGVIDAFRACGLNCFLPMEPAAGMDIVAVREKYPDLAMKGGIDKHVIRQSKADIRAELEYKLQDRMQAAGGMVFGLDHRIPNGTPIENYRYYVDLGREMLGIEPRTPDRKGWARMAF